MDLGERIVDVLTRVDDDGNGVYGADAIRHALPFLALSLELPLDELDDGMQALIAEKLAAAGGTLDGLLALYRDQPVDKQLLDDVRRAVAGEAPGGDARAAAALIGADARVTAPPQERPAGSIPGALARIRTQPKKP